MKNYWVANPVPDRRNLGYWYIDLPNLPHSKRLNILLAFAQRFMEIGRQYNIIRFAGMGDISFKSDQDYLDYMNSVAMTTDEVPFFAIGREKDRSKIPLRIATRLCYYNLKGEIEEKEVDDLGALLRELRPDRSQALPYLMRCEESIRVGGCYVTLEKEAPHDAFMYIRLLSDIWFPIVQGYMEEDYSFDETYRDNRDIAHCHTPRLNSFLADLRQLAEEVGGTWRHDKPMTYPYNLMFDETGVILDESQWADIIGLEDKMARSD